MKIDKKYSTILFGVFMSLSMSFSISLILTLVNMGLAPDFFEKWIRGLILGFAVSLPVSLIVVPAVRRIVGKLTSDLEG